MYVCMYLQTIAEPGDSSCQKAAQRGRCLDSHYKVFYAIKTQHSILWYSIRIPPKETKCVAFHEEKLIMKIIIIIAIMIPVVVTVIIVDFNRNRLRRLIITITTTGHHQLHTMCGAWMHIHHIISVANSRENPKDIKRTVESSQPARHATKLEETKENLKPISLTLYYNLIWISTRYGQYFILITI